MNSFLDVKTIVFVLALGHFFSGILVVAYMIRNKSDKSINTFLLSKSFELVAWILIILRGNIHDFLSIVLGNYFLIIGTTLQIMAFLLLKGWYNKNIIRIYFVLVLSYILMLSIVMKYFNIESNRVILISIYVVLLWIFPIFKLLSDHTSSVLQRTIAILYSMAVLSFAFRAYSVLRFGDAMTLMSSNFYNALSFIAMYMVMLVGGIGFILLAKEKSDLDLIKAATLDHMTNIYNRGTFTQHAGELISLHARKRTPISLLLMDLDNFKRVNDTYGHHTGDIVLIRFADDIKKQLRSYDLFGRFGGEEFVLLLPQTDENGAAELAERLRKSIEENPAQSINGIYYTISIGAVSMIPDSSTSIETLFNQCDQALYLAKGKGRNRVEFYKA